MEEPLERIERERQEKKISEKTLMVILAALAAAVVALATILVISRGKVVKTTGENKKYNELVQQLNIEKEELTRQVEALQDDFAGLTSEYDSINTQLDASREQIDQLVAQLKKTDATNRSKIRQYESELGTLRSIMRGYINQIDSLNTLNHRLAQEASEAREEAASQARKNEKLTAKNEELSAKVSVGSTLRARGLRIDALNAGDKIVDRAGRVKRMLVSLSLAANDLAPTGPVTIYVRVVAPDGSLLSDGRGTSFNSAGVQLDATASREVDYEGEEVDMSIYVNDVAPAQTGTYTMEAYTTSGLLGAAALVLR